MNKFKRIISLSCFLFLISCGNNNDVISSFDSRNSSDISLSSEENSDTIFSSNESVSISEYSEESEFKSSENIEKYTVTWINYDGQLLEEDYDVEKGSFPSYDGETPEKESDNDYFYVFDSWSPELSEVKDNITYQAIFKQIPINVSDIEGITPTFSSDKKTVKYGFYPQSYVSDSELIANLNNLETPSLNDWFLYEGNYYVKETAKVFNDDTTYKFNNGTTIVNESVYWFKCDVIEWNVLKSDNDSYLLLAKNALDASAFNNTYENQENEGNIIYSNNYEYSSIREFLNNQFFDIAFSLNNDYVKKTMFDNSELTTDSLSNKYVCNDTMDNVSLLSYKDYLNMEYGFENENDTSNSRIAYASDYARIKGIYCNKDKSYSSSYWTRSPSSNFSYSAWNVNTGGYLSEYMVNSASHSIRPCISVYALD